MTLRYRESSGAGRSGGSRAIQREGVEIETPRSTADLFVHVMLYFYYLGVV